MMDQGVLFGVKESIRSI